MRFGQNSMICYAATLAIAIDPQAEPLFGLGRLRLRLDVLPIGFLRVRATDRATNKTGASG